MPTNIQRTQSVCDALINGTATPAQMDHWGRALVGLDAAAWAALTNSQKAARFMERIRQVLINEIKAYEATVASEAAAISAAASVEAEMAAAP